MKKLGLVYLALVLCYGYCSSSLAQMLDPGTTVTLETIGEEVTSTTTIITNETTGDILGPDGTGIVAPRYEGDMSQDWGGKNSASMPNSCEFNTGTCAKGTSSATTFEQTIQISDYYNIQNGGALAWNLDFLHYQANSTGYIQSKGYDANNILQWDTDQVALPHNGSPTNHSGTYDFAGDLSKVNIIIGGGYYKFDNVEYVINYNTITTTTDSWLEIIEPLQQITQNIIMDNEPAEITPMIDMTYDMGASLTLPDVSVTSIDIMQPMEIEIPVEYQEVMVEVDTFVQEIKQLDLGPVNEPDMPDMAISNIEPVIEPPTMGVESPQEEPGVPEVPSKTEESEPEPVVQEIEVTKSEVKPVAVVEKEPEPEEIVVEAKAKEEPAAEKEAAAEKETAKPEPKQKETAAKEEPKEKSEPKEKTVAEKKQEKAEKIINSFESPYEAVAGLVTLRIMEALSADISVYQNQTIQDVAWYVQQQFYQDNVIPDPYGRYMSVRSSLDMEEMIASQYVK